jgi:hypothetical protein
MQNRYVAIVADKCARIREVIDHADSVSGPVLDAVYQEINEALRNEILWRVDAYDVFEALIETWKVASYDRVGLRLRLPADRPVDVASEIFERLNDKQVTGCVLPFELMEAYFSLLREELLRTEDQAERIACDEPFFYRDDGFDTRVVCSMAAYNAIKLFYSALDAAIGLGKEGAA